MDLRYGVALILLVAAVMVMSHQYTGVRHDGTLYAGEALARIFPGEFRDDIYFVFGSQGRFTVLPALYATLITAFGLGAGTMVGLLAAYVVYLCAATYLIRQLAPPGWRIACLLSVILGWTIYGGIRVFAYSEAFLTARSFAEPAVLFALGLLLRRRLVSAVVLLLVAAAIHPLIAAGGFLAAWVFLVIEDRRWSVVGIAALIVLAALATLSGSPFSDVFSRYDEAWLALVQEANPHAFILNWSWLDCGIIVFDLVVLGFAIRSATDRRLRTFLVALVVTGLGAILASLVLVDLLHDPFFGKLQLWRAEWVMQWVAMASLPLVLRALWRRDQHGRVAALFLVIGWMAPFSVAPGLLGIMATGIVALRGRAAVSRTTTWIVGSVALASGVMIAVQHEVRAFTLGALLDQPLHLIVGQGLAMNLVVLGVAFVFLRFVPRTSWFAPVLALALFAGSLALWDQRSAWTRRLESYPSGAHIWPGLIEPAAKVYWYRDLIAPWVLLGHGNYYTAQQGSGAVFSRDMIVELDKRRKVTGILDFQEQICRMMNNLNEKQTSCEPDTAAVRTVCTEGAIDYVVLQSTLEGAKPLADFSTGVVENGYEKKFFLYRCSMLEKR